MTSEWFVSCLMGFFKMSCSPYFCMYAELLEVTLNSYPSSQGPWTILYWRKYYASVQDKLVCHTNCLPSRFKWCFQGGTFTLFSFLREKKKLFVFMVRIFRKLEPSLARLSVEIWDGHIVFISSSSTQCCCIKIHAFLYVWVFQSS